MNKLEIVFEQEFTLEQVETLKDEIYAMLEKTSVPALDLSKIDFVITDA